MFSFVAAALVSVVAAASSGTPAQGGLRANSGPVEAGTIQSVAVYELDAAKCPALVDKDGRVCGAVRKFELKANDRARALSLVNDNLKGAPKACLQKAQHAFVFETTKGLRVVDVNFACHTLGGRALANKSEREIAGFMRLYGLVNGLGGL